ncbi:MAG: hypothetical protein AAB804_00815 [Patescibacteria group bacterium]
MQIFVPAPVGIVNDRVVILSPPAPKPTRPIVISYDVDPTAPPDTLGTIIATANRQENVTGTPPLGLRGNASASSSSVTSPDLRSPRGGPPDFVGELQSDAVQSGPPPSQEKASATTSQSTSSPRWPRVELVEFATAVDVGEAATIDSILANFSGQWTRVSKAPSQYKAALAQAQASYEAVVAQIGALQDALNGGLCDETCTTSIVSLQGELPVRRSHIAQLNEIVRKDEASPHPNPPPAVAQINRLVESVSPQGPGAARPVGPPTNVNIAAQETPKGSGEVPGEAVVLRVVKSIWKSLTSWFEPRPQASAPQKTCSLFLSLFGMCK